MTTNTDTSPRVYVGTYAKYNNGNLAGKWIDLDQYTDEKDFLNDCLELHKDEQDPELMFQDFEGFPREFYGESQLAEALWDWLKLDDYKKEIVSVYLDDVDQDAEPRQALEAYAGTFVSPVDWAEEYLDGNGDLDQMPDDLRMYFDYKAFARDAGVNMVHFCRHNGRTIVFHR